MPANFDPAKSVTEMSDQEIAAFRDFYGIAPIIERTPTKVIRKEVSRVYRNMVRTIIHFKCDNCAKPAAKIQHEFKKSFAHYCSKECSRIGIAKSRVKSSLS